MRQTAIDDLASIWKTVSESQSIEIADVLYTHLIATLKQIKTDFTIGKSMESVRDGYRVFMVGKYGIYYRADVDGLVEIVRVK